MRNFTKTIVSLIAFLMMVNFGEAQIISTIAGNGTAGFSGDGGLATNAKINAPYGICLDSAGNIFIADYSNHRIRKINSNDGKISTVAGSGTAGYNGDGISALSANLNFPTSVAVDVNGNIFIADRDNHRIRKVNASDGKISTIAGTGTAGYNNDGIIATTANLNKPTGVIVDINGNIFIADYSNNRVRKISASDGKINTIAGTGNLGYNGDGISAITASLTAPANIALDASNNLFIADANNNRIRKVVLSTGIISTVVGTGSLGFSGDGGIATLAKLSYPYGIFVDYSGNLFIADADNCRIRKVNYVDQNISTIAGTNTCDYNGDGILATAANVYSPFGVIVDKQGNIIIPDPGNSRIRKITFSNLPLNLLTFTAQQQNNAVNLALQTANEVNTSHFTIQRSVDATNFSEIGKVAAKGDGSYAFTDNQLPNATVVYYRLQMVDKDGSYTYSKVVAVALNVNRVSLVVFPNPVKDNLFVQITSTKAEKITLQVTDLQGKLLQQEDTQIGIGNVSLSVSTSALAKGSYVLLVKGTSGVQQKQFVKE